jgi:hypothetical protein
MSPLTIANELLLAAITLSGLPPVPLSDLPPLYAVSTEELAETICPGQPGKCQTIAAIFDTERYRILILSKLDLADPADNSFLLHELVHVLQLKQQGEAGFSSCQAIVDSERVAYGVQNRYLAMRNLFSQHGMMLRYMQCPPAEAKAAAEKSAPVLTPRGPGAPP